MPFECMEAIFYVIFKKEIYALSENCKMTYYTHNDCVNSFLPSKPSRLII